MPKAMRKGPPSAEDAAEEYGDKLNERLKAGRMWRPNVIESLLEEYRRLSWTTADGGTFDVQTVWEFYWLVYTTGRYLRSEPNLAFAEMFYERAEKDLRYFEAQILKLWFDRNEKQRMDEAIEQCKALMHKWVKQDMAWD